MVGTAVKEHPLVKRVPHRTSGETYQLQERILKLLRTEIHFIDSPEFHDPAVSGLRLGSAGDELLTAVPPPPAGLPRHLARLCEGPSLTRSEERDLFARMNYAKFRANILRSSLDPSRPDESTVCEIESLLTLARCSRDILIRAHLRLTISVVKRFVSTQRTFDELLSDGIDSLMLAVEKFDYFRGYRFSTYLHRSIVRNAYRLMHVRRREAERSAHDGQLNEWPENPRSSRLNEQACNQVTASLAELLHRLDPRERFIISGRFALGDHDQVETFQSLADTLGLSKERVRQLEQRAVTKMRRWYRELRIDSVMDPIVDEMISVR